MIRTARRLSLALLLLPALLAPSQARAAATDLQYAPATSSGHDFNHAPIGQSFQALAAQVRAGVFLADQNSYTDWLATRYPGQIAPGSYPNAVARSLRVGVKLIEGEGLAGAVLDSRELVLTAPYMGYVEIDYAAAGLRLAVGRMYTLLLTDLSAQAYPNGVTGWVVPSVSDYASGASLPPGAYAAGLPVLQNQLVFNDAGIGDNAFEVIDLTAGGGTPPAPPPACSGANAVIGTVEASYLTVNGSTAADHRVWYAARNAISFTGGTSRFEAGERLNYSGNLAADGSCQAASMTVSPAPPAVVVSGTLPAGQVGQSYAATLTASGGQAPYRWSAVGVPAGLSFSAGSFSGSPSVAGSSTVVVDTSDAAGTQARNSYQLTIAAAAPVDNGCSKPAGGRLVSGSGKVTAVTSSYFMVGLTRVNLASCTRIRYRGKDQQLKVGQTVSWDAYLVKTVQTAKDVTVP